MFTACTVESQCDNTRWFVTFPDHPGLAVILTSRLRIIYFLLQCGITPDRDHPDPTTITACPLAYLDHAIPACLDPS